MRQGHAEYLGRLGKVCRARRKLLLREFEDDEVCVLLCIDNQVESFLVANGFPVLLGAVDCLLPVREEIDRAE